MMKDLKKMGILDAIEAYQNKEYFVEELTKLYIEQIEKFKDKNAILEVFSDAIQNAKDIDLKRENGEVLGRLAGTVFVIKDNMLYKGHIASCASKFLEHFVAPYNATVVDTLLKEDAVIVGRANMDEFAMGGSNENSAFGACKNALDDSCVSGGSSGGSAVAVALDMCSAALGSDTGGSVRQPSSFNGVVGTKPTYGRVSRYGIVAFASSLDQVGPITKTVQDNAYLLNILAGHDENDQTTLSDSVDDYLVGIKNAISGMKIAYCKELLELYKKSNYYDNFVKLVEFLKSNGATVEEVSVPNIDLALPVYYIIAPAEATSNLTRFDGIKYTTRSEDSLDLNSLYVNSRTEGFGDEVKRRIMIGNYVLSSGFYDAYYVKAKKIQKYIVKMFNELFAKYDAMIMPVTYGEAFKIGSKNNDPVTMYLEDIFTVIANISSIPAISVPYSKGENNLPLGIQVLSKRLNEKTIFQIANLIESDFGGLGNE